MSSLEKPSNVTAAGALLLTGGIVATIFSLSCGLASYLVWLPWIFGVGAGIYAIIKGTQILGYNGTGPAPGVPTASAIMLIVNALNCDMSSMIIGIVALTLLNDEKTRAYLNGDHSAATGQTPSAAAAGAQASVEQAQGQEAPGPFVAPSPSSWGPPPQAEPAPEAPSWKASGWGADPFTAPSDGSQKKQSAPTLKEDQAEDVEWDDMADWERRFAETQSEEAPQEEEQEAHVGAGAHKKG